MPDPVAWKVVEKGWPVYDSGGEQVATIQEIAGDTEHDIFDGFGVKTSAHGHEKYVPAEIVGDILVGEVHLTIPASGVAQLEDLHAETEERILPEKSSWYQRLAWWTTGRNR